MKRLFCILLSLLMLTAAMPVWAADDLEPPLYEQYGYASMEEMITEWGMTDFDYWDMVEYERLWAPYPWDYDEQAQDFVPALWERYGYASMDEMLAGYGIDEAGYYDMVEEERLWQQQSEWTDEQ